QHARQQQNYAEQQLKDLHREQLNELAKLKDDYSKEIEKELHTQQKDNSAQQERQQEQRRQQQQYQEDRRQQRQNRQQQQKVRQQWGHERQCQNDQLQHHYQQMRDQNRMEAEQQLPDNERHHLQQQRQQKYENGKQRRLMQKAWRKQWQQELQDQRSQRQKEELERGLLPRCHPWSAQPLHCKLQESAYIDRQRMDANVACSLRKKFGLDPTLVLGNWSAGMMRHHPPIPGKGLRRMLIEQGFQVLLIDEFKTSTWCPYCKEEQLQKFLDVDNPQPQRRAERPVIKSHAVLRCNYVKCIGRVVDSVTGQSCPRIINCDLAACLNFRHIVDRLREHGCVPEHFMRSRRADTVPVAVPDDEPPAQHRRTE
ncbi:hypothetical protein H4S08_000579, partial [Coemansia sp. RSA 1365]